MLFEQGRAIGVEARDHGAMQIFRAGRVILSAGGIASPAILQRSGVEQAGHGFFCDPLRIVMAHVPLARQSHDIAMSAGYFDTEAGYMLSDITILLISFAPSPGPPAGPISCSATATPR